MFMRLLRGHPMMWRLLLAISLVGTAVVWAEDGPKKSREIVVTPEALAIHAEAIVVDGHNDLPWELRKKADSSFRNIDLLRPQPKLQTDIPRLKKGGVGVQFWSAWVPVDTAKKNVAIRTTMEQIDVIHRMVREYPNDFEMASTVDDILRIRKAGKIASLIGVEGGHSIDNSLGVLRNYYRLGVRYMTLTHSENVDWADASTDTPKVKGLTPFGEEVIREMNLMGMMVDLSHVSPDTMKAALKVTKAPVIYSHSSARGIADHPRNVPDDVLPLVKANNGVVMVNFFSGFVMPEGARAMKLMFDVGRDLRKKFPDDDAKYQEAMREWSRANDYPAGTAHIVVDHIEHIIKLAGIDHVGLGSDYDGISRLPAQLEDVSCYPVLTQELLNRGYKKADIHKILGGNLIRVMRDVEKVSKELSGKTK
jgi:membrane dipeptidase